MEKELQNDINRLVKALYKMSEGAKKETRAILSEAADPIIELARMNAPVGSRTHYRYKSRMLGKGKRRGKGQAERVATYRPGNLRDSIKGIFFRRAYNSIFIGPVLAKRPTGVFGPETSSIWDAGLGAKTDGYYAHMIEFGAPENGIEAHPFMRPAANALPIAAKIAVKKLTKTVNDYWNKYAKVRGR